MLGYSLRTRTNVLNKLVMRNLTFFNLRTFAKKYTKEHEWIELDKNVATIGITEFAQNELGEIVHVELPKIGDKYKTGDSLGAIESVKTAADIYAPIDGIVHEVNDKLTKNPKLINTSPLDQGWYARIKVDEDSVKSTIEDLMDEAIYEKFTTDSKK